jgi:hypothetical protein
LAIHKNALFGFGQGVFVDTQALSPTAWKKLIDKTLASAEQ